MLFGGIISRLITYLPLAAFRKDYLIAPLLYTMKPANSSELLDLEHALPTTWEDITALRRLRSFPRLSFADYLEFLARLPQVASNALRARKHPSGAKPFEL